MLASLYPHSESSETSSSSYEPERATSYSPSSEVLPDEFESSRLIRGAKQAYKKPTSDPVLASLYPSESETSSSSNEPERATSYSPSNEVLPDEFDSWRFIRRRRQADKRTADPVLQTLYPPESSENSEPSPPIGITRRAGSSEPRGMQFVARVTSVALFFVTLAAAYLVYTRVTRSPSPPQSSTLQVSKPAPETMGSAQSPLIQTPPEARDYSVEEEQPAPVEEPAPFVPYESPAPYAYEERRPGNSGRGFKATPPPAPYVLENRQPRTSGRSSRALPAPAPFVLENRQPRISAGSSPRLAAPPSNPKSYSPAPPVAPRAPANIPDATAQYERKRRVLPAPSDTELSPTPPRFNTQLIRMRSYRSLAGLSVQPHIHAFRADGAADPMGPALGLNAG